MVRLARLMNNPRSVRPLPYQRQRRGEGLIEPTRTGAPTKDEHRQSISRRGSLMSRLLLGSHLPAHGIARPHRFMRWEIRGDLWKAETNFGGQAA